MYANRETGRYYMAAKRKDIGIGVILLIVLLTAGCSKNKHEGEKIRDYDSIGRTGTLKAATIYGTSTYFILKDEQFGFDYELLKKFADEKGLKLDLRIAKSESELTAMIDSGEVDIVAYRLPMTNEYKKKYLYTNNVFVSKQVLVQRSGPDEITNVVQLLGKEVVVTEDSKYHQRLSNLNEELGGGIKIRTVADSVSEDDLIELVSQDSIDYTIAEMDIALLNKTYYKNLECKMAVSFSQRSAWVVRRETPDLGDSINAWIARSVTHKYYKGLYDRYFSKAKFFDNHEVQIPRGAISPYDGLFKKYSAEINRDWRLVAAIAHEESRFDPTVVSWLGARGIMQVMPATARGLGYSTDNLDDPETSILIGVKCLKRLEHIFSRVEDRDERMKFVIAAYNCGPGHVTDAQKLARKYGYNPHHWYGNVEKYLILKSQKEYYTDPDVKSGYFRGERTAKYVNDVLATYHKYMRRK